MDIGFGNSVTDSRILNPSPQTIPYGNELVPEDLMRKPRETFAWRSGVVEAQGSTYLKPFEHFRIRYARLVVYQERQPRPSKEISDLEWYGNDPPELTEYKGKYVAILEQEIIGWGDTVSEASQMAKQKVDNADPLIAFIEENHERLFSIGYVPNWSTYPIRYGQKADN